MRAPASLRRSGASPEGSPAWRERSGRLYEELRRPARAMIRRAFRRAFDDSEIEDIYSSAWLGTLRALEHRHEKLSDEEIRRYVLAAVANHASKELRRRKRRPTAPLDAVHAVPDDGLPPDERAAKLEHSRLTRDLLSSLPPAACYQPRCYPCATTCRQIGGIWRSGRCVGDQLQGGEDGFVERDKSLRVAT
jgi:DNA-directed RNA polymerase specialized sigma24 family protein